MKRTVAVIQTDQFSTDYGDARAEDTPPGRDFAELLLQHLLHHGMTCHVSSVQDDDWEHNEWCLFVASEPDSYRIRVECSFAELSPPKWYVCVTKNVGCLTSIWLCIRNKRGPYLEVQDSVLQLIEDCLKSVSYNHLVDWITLDDFEDELCSV